MCLVQNETYCKCKIPDFEDSLWKKPNVSILLFIWITFKYFYLMGEIKVLTLIATIIFIPFVTWLMELPRWLSGKESACQCRRHKMLVQSLDQEDSLEEGIATHLSILNWRIPRTEEPRGLWSIWLHSRTHLKWLHAHRQDTFSL